MTMYETNDVETAKKCFARGWSWVKNKRIMFEQGPTTFRMVASTDIFQNQRFMPQQAFLASNKKKNGEKNYTSSLPPSMTNGCSRKFVSDGSRDLPKKRPSGRFLCPLANA